MGNTLKRFITRGDNKKIKITNNQLINGKIPDKLIHRLITDDLEELVFSGCLSLTELPELPKGLQKLYLCGCEYLTTLLAFPEGLQELYIFDCLRLKELTELPPGLQKLFLLNVTT